MVTARKGWKAEGERRSGSQDTRLLAVEPSRAWTPAEGMRHVVAPARGMSSAYPFSAVVGLADLRQALLLNAVSPVIGGVLVRGEKGTAKSTMVRALAALLPDIAVVPGCRFACDPAAPDPTCPD